MAETAPEEGDSMVDDEQGSHLVTVVFRTSSFGDAQRLLAQSVAIATDEEICIMSTSVKTRSGDGSPGTAMTVEDRQLLLLKRRWDVLDQIKILRASIPPSVVALLLVTTAFVVGNDNLPGDTYAKVAVPLVLSALAGAGLLIFRAIHRAYRTIFDQIDYLYRKLDMDGTEYWSTFHRDGSDVPWFFIAVYVLLSVVGALCVIGAILHGFDQ